MIPSTLFIYLSLQSWGQQFDLCPPLMNPRIIVALSVYSVFCLLLGLSSDSQTPYMQNGKPPNAFCCIPVTPKGKHLNWEGKKRYNLSLLLEKCDLLQTYIFSLLQIVFSSFVYNHNVHSPFPNWVSWGLLPSPWVLRSPPSSTGHKAIPGEGLSLHPGI